MKITAVRAGGRDVPYAFIRERSMGIYYNRGKGVLDYVLNREDYAFHEGFMNLPGKPGLGVEVNEALALEENERLCR